VSHVSRKIDPETGSFVFEEGAWAWDDTGFSDLWLALLTEFGSVPADGDLGSRLVIRRKMGPNILDEARKDIVDAVAYVVEQGIVTDFQVVYVERHPTQPGTLRYGFVWRRGGDTHSYDGTLTIGTGES